MKKFWFFFRVSKCLTPGHTYEGILEFVVSFKDGKNVLKLIVVMVVQLYE